MFFCAITAKSQTVRLVRTDVDSTRENFVTATYMFAFDIAVENLENCNNASFRLKYDNASFVKYSGASIVDFGEEGTLFVYQNDVSGGDETILDIGVFSGQPLQENEFDDPTLINLEFVVLPTAPDNETVNFSFENAFGASFIDGVGQSIPLSAAPVNYDIHGFVEVWPGDSDRDGDVDNIDWTIVYENLKFKERFPGFRSFKRENPSTLWKPQRALVWDVEDATYADCDGDGEISVTDGAVVLLNITEDEGVAPPVGTAVNSAKENVENKLNESEIRVPIKAYGKNYFGILGSIELKNDIKDDFIRIEKGELFGHNSNIMFELKENEIEFVLGEFDPNFSINENGTVAYLVFEKKSKISSSDYSINNLKGITKAKNLIDLNIVNSIDVESSEIILEETRDQIRINSRSIIGNIQIFDLNGSQLDHLAINSRNYSLIKNQLPKGFLLLQIGNQTFPIINR